MSLITVCNMYSSIIEGMRAKTEKLRQHRRDSKQNIAFLNAAFQMSAKRQCTSDTRMP